MLKTQESTALTELCRALMVAQDVWPNETVNAWADNFLDPRLKEANTLVTDDGRLYTRDGKTDTIASISWTIFYSIAHFVTDQDNDGDYQTLFISDFARLKLQEAIIDGVNERLWVDHPRNKRLVLNKGVTYYEAIKTLRGGLFVPEKANEMGTSPTNKDLNFLASIGFRRVIQMVRAAMRSDDVLRWMAKESDTPFDVMRDMVVRFIQQLKEDE